MFLYFIFQVKRSNLLEYLEEMQGNGYALIGAEQAAQSISLSDFVFPKKAVVLLG